MYGVSMEPDHISDAEQVADKNTISLAANSHQQRLNPRPFIICRYCLFGIEITSQELSSYGLINYLML